MVQGKMAKLFKGQCLWCIENLGLCFPLEHSDKIQDKSPRWRWLSLKPFDAPDMFVKPKIRLCIEVIIFQFFVWKITELMVFFNNTVTDLPHSNWCLVFALRLLQKVFYIPFVGFCYCCSSSLMWMA